MAMRLRARCACSGVRSAGPRAKLSSPMTSTALRRASSRACTGVFEKIRSKRAPPPSDPPPRVMRPTSAWSPDSTFNAAPARRSSIDGSSVSPPELDHDALPPCSSTSMQWRPPKRPAAHCRMASLGASVSELHSKSPHEVESRTPGWPGADTGAFIIVPPRGNAPAGFALCKCCICCWTDSDLIHKSSTSLLPSRWMAPRPVGPAAASSPPKRARASEYKTRPSEGACGDAAM
mmetsp:Transcript_89197/g.257170  ORF Transcript_89197/g.257170 Transcript_89197/m.257170 type:complete len:234 (-) Transcript_89197:1210-1911(-)